MLVGIVGKPNVGKSTFFQALTSIAVERASRPFTTIKPNRGMGYVEIECVDKEFNVQCNPRHGFCINSRRFAPVELLDVAGLVPGAHEGKGLGNKFLDDLRQADALIHVIDLSGSTNKNGEVVEKGSYNPANDIRFLEDEMAFWIKGILENNWQKLIREKKKADEVLYNQLTGLGISSGSIHKTLLQTGLIEKEIENWSDEDKMTFSRKIREESKPIIIAANKCDISTSEENFKKLKEEFPNILIIPTSAEAEITLKEAGKKKLIDYIPGDKEFKENEGLNEQQKKALEIIKKIMEKWDGNGVQKCLNKTVFEVLKYIAVFPAGVNKLSDKDGNILPDVFLMKPGSTALDFAATIHSTMAEKFIKAIDVRTKKALGGDQILKNRDCIEIFFKH
jgi:ribosome-binding ATPase YchF (GTP1/OBG family)